MVLLFDFIYRQFIHTPPDPSVTFKGQTIIVTGSSSGLGLEACRKMVQHGASKVILAVRNVEKGEAAAKNIQATTSCSAETLQVWRLDMSSYASVISFADRVKSELPRLDVLLGNAGLGTRTFHMTEEDEEQITTNVVSTALLGFLLHPKLHETVVKFNTQTHFTVVGSELYEYVKFKERNAPKIFAALKDQKTTDLADRYPTSKLLLLFVIKQMATMSPIDSSGVIINVVAPGFCSTELTREVDGSAIARFIIRILTRPAEVGARTLVYGASAGSETHGGYLPDCNLTTTGGLTKGKTGAELQNRIWLELKQKLETIKPGVTSL